MAFVVAETGRSGQQWKTEESTHLYQEQGVLFNNLPGGWSLQF